jgi:hypothetical protein
MGAVRAAISAVPLAVLVAGCTMLSAGKPGRVNTGSVEPQERQAPAAAPSIASFEATELSTGLKCTGSYSPLENSRTFTAPVVCDDGRMGEVTAARSRDLSGTGTLAFSGGGEGTVALRILAASEGEAPPPAASELPPPDPSTYVR